jgi:hypothetical protein
LLRWQELDSQPCNCEGISSLGWKMSSGQIFVVIVLITLAVGRLLAALKSPQKWLEELLDLGFPAVGSALVGGLRLLVTDAQVARSVTSIVAGGVVSGGSFFRIHDVNQYGDKLLFDSIAANVVFLIALALVLYERAVAGKRRGQARSGFGPIASYALIVVIVPIFFGSFALTLIYVRS